jgi:hypothetical protein
MGSSTLIQRADAQTIDASWFNNLRSAFLQDVVSRNSSGIATDQAGSLGTSALRFLNAYLMNLFLMDGSHYISQKAPSGLANDFTMTWPGALPGAGTTRPLQINDSGIITFAQLPTQGIADDAVTFDKLFNRTVTTGGSATGQNGICVGVFATDSLTGTSTKTLIKTGGALTCSGARPVFVGLSSVGSGAAGTAITGSSFSGDTTLYICRSNNGGADTDIFSTKIYYDTSMGSSVVIPASSVWTIDDTAPSGSNVYKVKLENANSSVQWSVRSSIICWEMT